jgi:AcrR family transcriptional regulator
MTLATGLPGREPENMRKRLPRQTRERMIIDEAIKFFAEAGFEGQTRALAERLGVTQPLLYRYFPDKESLVQRVYDEVYLSRWKEEWPALLTDPSLPLRERLIRFFVDFYGTIYDYSGVRIFLFAGLKGLKINKIGLGHLMERVVNPVCNEIRKLAGLPSVEERPLSMREMEVYWNFHGLYAYRAIRKSVYGADVPGSEEEAITEAIDDFLSKAPEAFKRLAIKNGG